MQRYSCMNPLPVVEFVKNKPKTKNFKDSLEHLHTNTPVSNTHSLALAHRHTLQITA